MAGLGRRRHERRARLLGGRLAAGARGPAGGRASPCCSGTAPARRCTAAAAALWTSATPGGWPSRPASPTTPCAWTGSSARRWSTPSSPTTWPAARPSPCVRCNTWIKFDLLLERARALRRRAGGHRPLRAHPGRPRRPGAAHRARPGQGPELLPLRADAGAARGDPLSARRDDQARGARELARRPGWWWPRRARAWRSASWPAACASSSRSRRPRPGALRRPRGRGPRAARDPGRRRRRGARRGRALLPLHRGPAPRPGPRRRPPALRAGGRAGGEPGGRGRRGADCSPPASPASACTGSARADRAIGGGEVEATVKIRSRHPGVAARIRPLGRGERRSRDRLRRAPARQSRPARRRCSTSGTRVLGGCWIEGHL